jgi:hypothetical protein
MKLPVKDRRRDLPWLSIASAIFSFPSRSREEAEVPLRRAVGIYDRQPAPRAKDHAGAQHRLGLAIARAGRRVEALPHLKRSTILAQKFFAEE